MAEYVVSTVVEKLTNWITEEALLLEGVGDKVEQLRDGLRWMQSFLKDADVEQEKNERLRNWVSQIREVALDAEDVIETYIAEAASHSSWNIAAKLINLYWAGKKIGKIQSRVQNISSQKEHFGITGTAREGHEGTSASPNERLRWWRQTSPNIEEDDLVGLIEDTEALLRQLSTTEPRRRVVSIVGMGGLGKTTLAKKLYNHSDLKNEFDCKAFVYVYKDYRRRDTLQGIIVAVNHGCNMEDLKKLQEEELVLKLRQLLQEKRYLVVLDDIWEIKVWDSLQSAFPSGKMGSKVMLTTRNKEIALYADAMSEPLEPQFLTQDESFELFRKKAFPGMNEMRMPSDLENLGRQMMVKCSGLPLTVVVLGGLLSTKRKTAEEWTRVLQNINWRLIGQDRVSAVLALSYNDLPFHLKSCFLYLGLFPEDSSISKRKLIHLWVAEGFLPQQGEEVAEGVAENCLNELIDRCMVKAGISLGRVKTIRMHDLLRDFSVLKGNEECFLEVHSGHKIESPTPQRTKSRRLAIHVEDNRYVFLKPYAPYLRSLQFFKIGNAEIGFIYKDFKLLRVLDGVPVQSRALGAVGNLIQLRYLGLVSRSDFKYARSLKSWARFAFEFPRLIGKLKNLLILKLENCIPDVIWKMKNLRHLFLSGTNQMNLRLDTLSNLRTLKNLGSGRWIEDGGLVNLTNLQRLKIVGLKEANLNSVFSNIEGLHCLESLSLEFRENESLPPPLTLSHFEHLLKLHLDGKIVKLPARREFPPNLIKLRLLNSYLDQDSIRKLGRLPNLQMLLLGAYSYNWKELVCRRGFPQLHILHIEDIPNMELIVEAWAMKKLTHLKVRRCPGVSIEILGRRWFMNIEVLDSSSIKIDVPNR
ncbi:disease resistance protein RPP13-like [Prunus avium]|uniref:Disease resistance protein RPP13-like n=1 Tax=Prunus avium TaxID=42229 RepID=A0A6P5TZX5_PRUAV|nr:disease resistance protein RPP13-like [Prunus avium]